jgi:hypothetical protein
MRSRRRVRVSGAQRVRAFIFCEGLRVCASTTVTWWATQSGQRSSTAPPMIGWSGSWMTRVGVAGLWQARVHPLVALVSCASCGGRMTTAIAPRRRRGYGCRKDEHPICPARVRIVAEPLEALVEGCVIDPWRNPEAIKIARSAAGHLDTSLGAATTNEPGTGQISRR